MPSWSHNGNYIYFTSRRSGLLQVWKMAGEVTGALIPVTTRGGWVPLESADGTYLFFTKPMNPGLWWTPVSGGQEQQVFSDMIAAHGSAYTPTRNGIYFIRQANSARKQTLVLYRFADKRMITLADIPRPVDMGVAVSPDERTVLYSQIDHVSSELMLVEDFR